MFVFMWLCTLESCTTITGNYFQKVCCYFVQKITYSKLCAFRGHAINAKNCFIEVLVIKYCLKEVLIIVIKYCYKKYL